MKKRIFSSMIMLTLISLILVTAALCMVFYRQFSSTLTQSLRNRAETFVDNSSRTAIEALAITKSSDMRVTLITPDGMVDFDNMARAQDMPNHLDREEIRSALENGYGQGIRFSDTLQKETIYYAVRLTDGYVLRVAKTSSSIWGVFIGILPVVACVVLIMIAVGYYLAGRLTRRIITPLEAVNPSCELCSPYDELAPFIKTIADQREHMARQLSELQNRTDTINAIMDNMNEGILLTNKQGVVLSANRSVLRIFDKGCVVEGKNILEFFRDISFSRHVNDALEGKIGEMSIDINHKTYRVYFSHVIGGGAIILFLDITEKAESERLRREFSANVSHELKTPLTSIYGSAEMLHNGMVREHDKQAFYGQIKNKAGHLIELIEDILMISRLDEGGGQELDGDVDITAVANEAIQALLPKAEENNVTISIAGESICMSANRSQMYEVFFNLIDNAIKYNVPGGTVNVDILNNDEQIKIVVADTGIGIPKEAQSRVFERFYRVDKSRSKKTGGTGLGLAIVKHIVMVHGGRIEMISRVGEGTNITLLF